MINEELLFSLGADIKIFETDDHIFSEGEFPNFFFFLAEGMVKLNNYSETGKEFIQGIFSKGKSLGESFLFCEKAYPVNAVAIEECEIIRLSKATYLEYLKQNPELYYDIVGCLSEHMNYKFLMMQTMAFQNPSHKLITLLDYLKYSFEDKSSYSMQVNLTRQQLASLTGLSVETVIRVIKMMEKKEILQIRNRKIFY